MDYKKLYLRYTLPLLLASALLIGCNNESDSNSIAASNAVLTQIGLEADNPDVVNSIVTVEQLAVILPPLTDIIAANEAAYQDDIDANPDLYSSPAKHGEVQARIRGVNSAKAVDAEESNVTANPTSIVADGITTSTISVTVKNAKAKPITNAKVTLEQGSGSSTISEVTNVGDGTYTFTVKSTKAETVTYVATADTVVITQTADVTFINVPPLPENITIDNAELQKAIGSIIDTTPYAIDVQGVIDAGGLTVTVPYTVVSTPVTLPEYNTSVILDASITEDSEAGIIATFAWTEQTSLPVGQGTFTATITIDDSGAGIPDNTYNAKKLDIQDDIAGVTVATFPYATDDVGGIGTLTLKIYPGIPDRMFGTVDNTRNADNHMFLYLPITNPTTGKTWLNNNLGANYANINDSAFDIAQQATSSNDHNAYGSLFQWGRKADGHELITWTDGATGTGTNGTIAANSDDPANALFITEPDSPYDWRVTPDDTLWANETSTNNVCPVGYRVPTAGETGGELQSERLSWGSNDAAGALSSALALTLSGLRYNSDGTVLYEGTSGNYWGSTVSIFGTYAQSLNFHENTAYMDNDYRVYGFSVRCIKD